jgi:hypothetical protein
MYMPDGIAGFTLNGVDYIVTANEGDARTEDSDAKDVTLDATVFPNAATLQNDNQLGDLKVSTIDGDLEPDGDFDQLYIYGARSFSIWRRNGNDLFQVFDSGDDFEQITAVETPTLFNADDGLVSEFDERSDNKGPEPEAIKVVDLGIRKYAFVGLERAGSGFLVYDINNPSFPKFIDYIRHPGDIALEDLIIISEADSPTGQALVVTANEVSNSISVFSIDVDEDAQLLADIPTMGEWSFLLFGLILINVCVVFIYQNRKVLAY